MENPPARPLPESVITQKPRITYLRPPTHKNLLAPSRLRQHVTKQVKTGDKGVFKCARPQCKCCDEINHQKKKNSSNIISHKVPINMQFMLCHLSNSVLLRHSICRPHDATITQKTQHPPSQHTEKSILLSIARHVAEVHPEEQKPFP